MQILSLIIMALMNGEWTEIEEEEEEEETEERREEESERYSPVDVEG